MTRFRLVARHIALVAVLGAATTLAACNTVSGAGQDVSAVGHGVSSGATSVANHL